MSRAANARTLARNRGRMSTDLHSDSADVPRSETEGAPAGGLRAPQMPTSDNSEKSPAEEQRTAKASADGNGSFRHLLQDFWITAFALDI